ncbi:hypothetical protein [Haliscomenobacter sp.]|uniref:hypothetical protein n=1 Tax=Haliscomenobacter sp. TaxID=2717303 RepID=UPI003BAA1C93
MLFNRLEQEEVFKILDISLQDLRRRLANINFTLFIGEEAKQFIAEKAEGHLLVAHYFPRVFQRYLEDPLADFILNGQPEEGALLEAILTDEKDNLRIVLAKEVNTDVKE